MEQNTRQTQTVTLKPVSAKQRSSNQSKDTKLPANSAAIKSDPIKSIDQYSRSSTLLLDDKELKLESVAAKKRLNTKIGQTSDKFCVSNKSDPNENFHPRSCDQRTFNNNTDDFTEISKGDVKNLTEFFQQKSQTNSKVLTSVPHIPDITSSQRKSNDRKVACHLYEHLPKITDNRNDSTNSDTLTTSSTNLNLKLNKFGISRKSKLSKQRFLNVMDRSVDSIGSCSLDVDADSTFSGI